MEPCFAAAGSDVFWQSFFLFCQAVFGGIVVIVLERMRRGIVGAVTSTGQQAGRAAATAAGKVEEVRTTLVSTASDTTKGIAELTDQTRQSVELGKSTHQLVNSAMAEQLSKFAKMARIVANLLPDSKEARETAEEAERAVAMHKIKQLAADDSSAASVEAIVKTSPLP